MAKVSITSALRYPNVLILIAFGVALADVISTYNIGGIGWDFIAKVLYAKSLLSPSFYSALLNGNLANAINYGNRFYFESLRAPLMGLVIAPFIVLGGDNFVPLYLLFGLVLLLFSVIYLSRAIEIDPLLLTLLFFTPYVIFFFYLLNGAEILSMSFVLIYIGLISVKRWQSGIVMAVAGLAKYPSLIFLPLLLLLPKGARKNAFISFGLATLPWLAFNTIVWHNPIFSYLLSIVSFSADKSGIFNTTVILNSLELILPDLVPAFLIALALLMARYIWKESARKATTGKGPTLWVFDYRHKVVFATFAVGLSGWLVTAIGGTMNDLPRLGYLLYIGIALILGILITELPKKLTSLNKSLRTYALGLLFIATLGMLASAFISMPAHYIFGAYGSTNKIYQMAKSALAMHNLSNCSVISNDWVYLIYAGIKAHYPYSYNATEQRYPIVYFTSLGANNSAVNLINVTSRLNYTYFYIAFPRNWTCV